MKKQSVHRGDGEYGLGAKRGTFVAKASDRPFVTKTIDSNDVALPVGVGHTVFAIAIAGLGVLSLVTGHFASVWQPVPLHLPARVVFACANGVLMLLLGLGLLVKRTTGIAAVVVTAYFLIWFLVLHGPKVISAPTVANTWAAFGENGTLIVGGLMLIATNSTKGDGAMPDVFMGSSGIRTARVVFAFAAFLMSLSNLAYPKANADFPPSWIPHWYCWGFLVGGAYVATGLGILFRICPRLATHAAAAMMSLFTGLCWITFVVEAPTNRMNWTALLISSALTGAAWMVAESYRNDPWFEWPLRSSSTHPSNRNSNSKRRS